MIIYEIATPERPSFSHHWKPEDAKEHFVDGRRPDLSAIEDACVKMVLEKIFILDPEERLQPENPVISFGTWMLRTQKRSLVSAH